MPRRLVHAALLCSWQSVYHLPHSEYPKAHICSCFDRHHVSGASLATSAHGAGEPGGGIYAGRAIVSTSHAINIARRPGLASAQPSNSPFRSILHHTPTRSAPGRAPCENQSCSLLVTVAWQRARDRRAPACGCFAHSIRQITSQRPQVAASRGRASDRKTALAWFRHDLNVTNVRAIIDVWLRKAAFRSGVSGGGSRGARLRRRF